MSAVSEWNHMVRHVARRKGWEAGNTEFEECTCLELWGASWTEPAEYHDDPYCWYHGEELDREEWCREQGEEWCRENDVDPATGKPADGSEWD